MLLVGTLQALSFGSVSHPRKQLAQLEPLCRTHRLSALGMLLLGPLGMPKRAGALRYNRRALLLKEFLLRQLPALLPSLLPPAPRWPSLSQGENSFFTRLPFLQASVRVWLRSTPVLQRGGRKTPGKRNGATASREAWPKAPGTFFSPSW